MRRLINKFKFLALPVVLGACLFAYSAPSVQAADVLQICNERPNAAVCRDRNPNPDASNNPLFGTDGIITEIINIISILIGIAAVIMIIMAGMRFVTSGSNPQEVSTAREMIVYAVVGLVVASIAQLLVRFVLNRLFG